MKTAQWDSLQPRFLRHRGHYKTYLFFALVVCGMLASFWSYKFFHHSPQKVWNEQWLDLVLSGLFFTGWSGYYFFWLRSRLKRSVQVFPNHILIHDGKNVSELKFEDVESVTMVYWSLFYFKMKDGYKHYFSSGLERVDYVWEGLKNSRPELMQGEEFENFRLKLVQYDHHQKRKEWFFRHRMVDIFNWFALPVLFLFVAYFFQSKEVVIHQQGLYFFRLFMYSLLVLLVINFTYSILLKRLVFDKHLQRKLSSPAGGDKFRDIEFEGVILQRSKIFQVLTSCFIFAVVIKGDLNFYSVTKIKETMSSYQLMKGKTVLVDNRFNCTNCRYQVRDGDVVLFGKGFVGEVMARSGEMVGEISHDKKGRNIASSNVHAVPEGHVAVRSNNGQDLIFVKVSDLVGKIQN